MAGHSHWHNIQQKKGKNDAKKGVIFTRAALQIILAAREGGGDPNHNLSLRIAIDAAKAVNMPKDNIERAIQKGAGTGETQLVKALYEGYAPGNIPMLMLAITDNKNRTVNEIRTLFGQNDGQFGEPGSVQWQFTENGLVEVKAAKIKRAEKFGEQDEEVVVPGEQAELELMDVEGIQDIDLVTGDDMQVCYVTVPMHQLAQITNKIKDLGYVVLSSGQYFFPNNPLQLDADKTTKFEAFLERIEDHPDIQKVWHGAATV